MWAVLIITCLKTFSGVLNFSLHLLLNASQVYAARRERKIILVYVFSHRGTVGWKQQQEYFRRGFIGEAHIALHLPSVSQLNSQYFTYILGSLLNLLIIPLNFNDSFLKLEVLSHFVVKLPVSTIW